MNKKIKFLSSTLSALLLTSGIALTNVHAQSAVTSNISSLAQTSGTISGSNKGYNYTIYLDAAYNVHVNISPDDYKNHTYKVTVSFQDKNNTLLSQATNTEYCLTYAHAFGIQKTWAKANVRTYYDMGGGNFNLISDTVITH